MILKFVHIIILIIWPIHLQASAQSSTMAKPGCNSQCGGVEIPYPFGMNGSECYADKWFEIECRNGSLSTPEPSASIDDNRKPYLKSIGVEVTFIDVSGGTVDIMNPIYRSNCGTKGARLVNKQLGGSPFVYSQEHNKFVAAGCNSIALLQSNGSDVSGCVSICDDDNDDISNLGNTECHGKSCCETSLPQYLSEYNATIKGLNEKQTGHHCSFAMIVQDYHRYSYNHYNYYDSYYPVGGDLKDLNDVPAVLEWEIVNNLTLKLPADAYAECHDTKVTSSRYKGSGRRCSCKLDSSGNPYIAGGCRATSPYPYYEKTSRAKSIITGVFASLGSIILLLVLWRLYKVVRKKIVKKRKEKFFKQNGGLLLEQRLSSGEVNVDKVKLFSLKDLEKATDHFNTNRVLGKGGQGTVYKGMLIDGKIIAVKKFKVEGKVEEFINEFVILSQINHRNVVKLLGSCLETEIPLLVYEFVPNGNLFEYLHEQNEDLPMTWDMRLRIATEVAGALFYLHSAASQPIYHRDIKSTNILLDEKYRAKIADFGTSRMVSIEATHLTTVVQGTFGYLDPEYFHTSQFTEKSDVYSFGVVLVELLTGQKPISSLRPMEAKSLASYFILCIEENRLFDIIDERVMKEGLKEHIIAIANLASRCLELNGKKRPTMKEVTLELEGIRKLDRKSNTQETQDELELVRVEDYQSWAEYSTTSNIMSTLDLNSRTPTLEDIHILTI
ncbi:Wall-associated receptor kinase 22 [Spatholobus suberectus]|nr:Wall-associated receptor kinase 22 [Spatholobus suberectus]